MTLEEMKNIDVRTVDRDSLVDITTIEIPEDLSPEERAKEFIRQVKNPYCFRVGDMVVKIVYNEGGPTFQECFEQYLRTTLRYREVMPGNRG